MTLVPFRVAFRRYSAANASTKLTCSALTTSRNSKGLPILRKFSQSICHIGTPVEVQFISSSSEGAAGERRISKEFREIPMIGRVKRLLRGPIKCEWHLSKLY